MLRRQRLLSLATRRKCSDGDNLNYTRGGEPEAKYGQVVKKIASVYGVLWRAESSLAPLSLGDEISFFPSPNPSSHPRAAHVNRGR